MFYLYLQDSKAVHSYQHSRSVGLQGCGYTKVWMERRWPYDRSPWFVSKAIFLQRIGRQDVFQLTGRRGSSSLLRFNESRLCKLARPDPHLGLSIKVSLKRERGTQQASNLAGQRIDLILLGPCETQCMSMSSGAKGCLPDCRTLRSRPKSQLI